MYRSTISYESLAESLADSIGSSVLFVALPYLAPAIDLESEPFEDPKSPVASDHDFVDPLFDSKPFIAAYPSSPPPSPAHSRPSHKRPRSSPSSSAGSPSKRCRESPAPASPTPVIHSVPIELLPPHKRFTASERIETINREVVTLIARLAAVET
ncbi:hypothetical protein Tco_0971804 [Tanacetum coccineum]